MFENLEVRGDDTSPFEDCMLAVLQDLAFDAPEEPVRIDHVIKFVF